MTTKKEELTFITLASIDVSKKVDTKNGLSYLPWAQAWGIVKQQYPGAQYEVTEYEDGRPYLHDEYLGYMVSTSVSISGETLCMHLPVMDNAHKAMKHEPYTYKVKDWNASRLKGSNVYIDKHVAPATMFDINKAIMRCLVKNLALFGLGLSLYTGDDIIDSPEEVLPPPLPTPKPAPKKTVPKKPKRELIELTTDGENWKKVMLYIADNKDLTLTQVGKKLGLKYRISPAVKKEIGEKIKSLKNTKDGEK